MLRINQVRCRPGHSLSRLRKKAADMIHVKDSDILSFTIVRQSIDARKKTDIFYNYTLDVVVRQEEKVLNHIKGSKISRVESSAYRFPDCGKQKLSGRPVIIGMGPAGLFCGYFLALHGYRPLLLERGADVDTRMQDVESFWHGGPLRPDSNVQFGEGGAGTFSDGKLNTLIKDKDGRNQEVLRTFVKFGAKDSILYEAKPHLGTDVLCEIVKQMREEIIRLGGEVRFHSQVTDLLADNTGLTGLEINGQEQLPCNLAVLAIGHSARDTFAMLFDRKVPLEAKAFAVGLRVEHPQKMINLSQYGTEDPGLLGAAPYKLTARTTSGRGVYSFCMCPGGYVVNASSEPNRLAINGMSYSGRDGVNANSAVIVSVTPKDFGSSHPLAGIAFQRELEEKAYSLGGGRIPVQRYGIFRKCVQTKQSQKELEEGSEGCPVPSFDELSPQNKGGYAYADVSRILPDECNRAFVEGMEQFGHIIPGFNREDVLLSGVESRTSSPVKIPRGENWQSSIRGLYPCGEGAGYAGGITSAAIDGLGMAEKIAAEYAPFGDNEP